MPVTSVQIAGVSYDNLGEAGLHFLSEMAAGGGQARVLTTLNPAGMDVENWQRWASTPNSPRQQQRVIEAFARMGVVTTCSCTPYLTGNVPHLRRTHRLGREQRGLLCQFRAGRAHQPRRRPQRPGRRPDRFYPGLWPAPGREPPPQH